MASTQKWVAGSGVGFTWTDAFSTATLNSIASASAILSDISITNQTALDVYADLSISLASAAFTGAGACVGVSVYYLNHGGTVYGDGRFAAAAAGPAPYLVGSIPLVAATQAQNGILTGIVISPGTYKFVLTNSGGIQWAGSSGNTCQYRTYNLQGT